MQNNERFRHKYFSAEKFCDPASPIFLVKNYGSGRQNEKESRERLFSLTF